MAVKTLLVEDDINLLVTLRYNLAEESYEVVTTGGGAEALQTARGEKPALIILDVMLPRLSGFGVCRILRQETNTPVLMLTAKAEDPRTITQATRLI